MRSSDSPSVFSLLQAIELGPTTNEPSDAGVYYPLGGFGTVREALLEAVERSGVHCRWNTTATHVAVERGCVVGVGVAPTAPSSEETAETLPATVVVVNADVATAEVALLPRALRRSTYAEVSEVRAQHAGTVALLLRKVGRALQEAGTTLAVALKSVAGTAVPGTAEPAETLRRTMGSGLDPSRDAPVDSWMREGGWQFSSSSVSFYWCTDRRYDALRHHNVFLAAADAWESLFDATAYAGWAERIATSPMHFYVHCPSRTDASVCESPTDDAIMVLVPVPPVDERLPPDEAKACTERLVERARDAVFAAFAEAGLEDFKASIVDERVRTPLMWREMYGLRRGAVFGLSHNLAQLSYLRPSPTHGKDARGLYWVGASTRPGNGVPLVLIGAKKVAAEAIQYARNGFK